MLIANRTEANDKNTAFLFTSSSNKIEQGKTAQRTIILKN